MHSVSLAPVARCHFPPTPGFIGRCCPVRISKAIRSHTARRESSASVALKFTLFGAFCRLCARVREYHIRRSAAATCLPSLSFSSIDLLTPAAAHLITRRHLRPSPQWFCDLHLQVSAALVVFRFRVRVRRAARLRLAVRGRRSAVSSPPLSLSLTSLVSQCAARALRSLSSPVPKKCGSLSGSPRLVPPALRVWRGWAWYRRSSRLLPHSRATLRHMRALHGARSSSVWLARGLTQHRLSPHVARLSWQRQGARSARLALHCSASRVHAHSHSRRLASSPPIVAHSQQAPANSALNIAPLFFFSP